MSRKIILPRLLRARHGLLSFGSLVQAVLGLVAVHIASSQEGWLYVGEYPYVWSDAGQDWLLFEYPTQPVYSYGADDWPVLFDEISLEQLVLPDRNHLILLHAGPHWMLIRFNAASMEEPAQIFEFAEAEPVMEGVSHYTIDDRDNTMLLTVFLEDNQQGIRVAASLDLDFSYQDGGWFSMTATSIPGPGTDELPSPIAGFLPDSTGSFWFYSQMPEQLPE